jgi:hypothetical protein
MDIGITKRIGRSLLTFQHVMEEQMLVASDLIACLIPFPSPRSISKKGEGETIVFEMISISNYQVLRCPHFEQT